MVNVKTLRKKTNLLLSDYNATKSILDAETQRLANCEKLVKRCLRAQGIIQDVAANVQQVAHSYLESTISRAIKTTFGEEVGFKINFEQKRGKTEAELCFTNKGNDVDPIEASGGGLLDLASFALRLTALMLSRPRPRAFLSLDEPFRCVSKNHVEKIQELLLALSEEFQLQIFMVTHNTELECGRVVRLIK